MSFMPLFTHKKVLVVDVVHCGLEVWPGGVFGFKMHPLFDRSIPALYFSKSKYFII
jgi:hypothetical protein